MQKYLLHIVFFSDDYLTSFKKRLVREASDLTHLYVRAASDVYPGKPVF